MHFNDIDGWWSMIHNDLWNFVKWGYDNGDHGKSVPILEHMFCCLVSYVFHMLATDAFHICVFHMLAKRNLSQQVGYSHKALSHEDPWDCGGERQQALGLKVVLAETMGLFTGWWFGTFGLFFPFPFNWE